MPTGVIHQATHNAPVRWMLTGTIVLGIGLGALAIIGAGSRHQTQNITEGISRARQAGNLLADGADTVVNKLQGWLSGK